MTKVTICICTNCIMNGNMDIYTAIKNLRKLDNRLHFNKKIDIALEKYIILPTDSKDTNIHLLNPPVIKINDTIYQDVQEDVIMATIINLSRKR